MLCRSSLRTSLLDLVDSSGSPSPAFKTDNRSQVSNLQILLLVSRLIRELKARVHEPDQRNDSLGASTFVQLSSSFLPTFRALCDTKLQPHKICFGKSKSLCSSPFTEKDQPVEVGQVVVRLCFFLSHRRVSKLREELHTA